MRGTGTYPQQRPPSLFADAPEEAARLLLQHRLFTSVLGGLFPVDLDLSRIRAVLDLGCGPGGWVLDVARTYPTIKRIIGIDSRATMIEMAQLQSLAEGSAGKGLPAVEFRTMDARQPLRLSRSFDYIRGQSLASLLVGEDWPHLVHECLRLLRPGGVLCLVEAELAGTTSAAFEEFSSRFVRAFHQTRRSLVPGDVHVGITPVLKRLLQEAGFQQVEQHASVLNFSWGERAYEGMYQEVLVAFKLLQPFLLDAGVTTLPRFGELYQQVLVEMQSDAFCGMLILVSTLGKKPTAST